MQSAMIPREGIVGATYIRFKEFRLWGLPLSAGKSIGEGIMPAVCCKGCGFHVAEEAGGRLPPWCPRCGQDFKSSPQPPPPPAASALSSGDNSPSTPSVSTSGETAPASPPGGPATETAKESRVESNDVLSPLAPNLNLSSDPTTDRKADPTAVARIPSESDGDEPLPMTDEERERALREFAASLFAKSKETPEASRAALHERFALHHKAMGAFFVIWGALMAFGLRVRVSQAESTSTDVDFDRWLLLLHVGLLFCGALLLASSHAIGRQRDWAYVVTLVSSFLQIFIGGIFLVGWQFATGMVPDPDSPSRVQSSAFGLGLMAAWVDGIIVLVLLYLIRLERDRARMQAVRRQFDRPGE